MSGIDLRSYAQMQADGMTIGKCPRGHDCVVIDVTRMGSRAPDYINGICHECAGLCDWCDHHRNEHSLILASAPCLDCPCPSYHRSRS